MVREIPLSQGYVALVDDEDFDRVSHINWYVSWSGKIPYAANRTVGKLHRLLICAQPGEFVDHRNGNSLDCRQANLRICTKQQNCQNRRGRPVRRSIYKGVSFHSRQVRQWCASIRRDGKAIWLGSFATEQEAALAYDQAAREAYGDFCCVNFPREGERAE